MATGSPGAASMGDVSPGGPIVSSSGMSSPQDLDYPHPRPDDPASVAAALQAGSQEWSRGELREAVRWIRRAAEAAEAEGDDGRALGLARVAADVMSTLELPNSMVPPRDEATALAPLDDFNEKTIVDTQAAILARHTIQGPVQIEERPIREDPFSVPTLRVPARVRREPEPGPEPHPARPKMRGAFRVALSVTDADDVLLARVLDESAPPGAGTTEALLVVVDPDAPLLDRLRR